jgi:hypothetical protein
MSAHLPLLPIVLDHLDTLSPAVKKQLPAIIARCSAALDAVHKASADHPLPESWPAVKRELKASATHLGLYSLAPAALVMLVDALFLYNPRDEVPPEPFVKQVVGVVRPELKALQEAVAPDSWIRIRLVGDEWEISFGNQRHRYPRRGDKAIVRLCKILANPCRRLGVADVDGDPDGRLAGDGRSYGEVETDRQGANALYARIQKLQGEIEEYGADETREAEMTDLLRQLERANNGKKIRSPGEKAHHKIASGIRDFVNKKLLKDMPDLYKHLEVSLKLDAPHFVYSPNPRTDWKID